MNNFLTFKKMINYLGPMPIFNSTLGNCWIWLGRKNSDGYAHYWFKNKRHLVHRLSYFFYIGEVPKGLQLDHLCRNRACVNPSHLEPVTGRINTLRGTGPAAINAKKTHCIRGHEFTKENTGIQSDGKKRYCKKCFINWKDNYLRNLRNKTVLNKKPPKKYCKRGHEFSGKNLHINKKGFRICLACRHFHNLSR